MKKNLFVVIHTHKFRTSVGFIKATEQPDAETACKALDFDYESDPVMEESVEIIQITPKDAVEI